MEPGPRDIAFAGLPADLPARLAGPLAEPDAAPLLALARAAADRLPGLALRVAAKPDDLGTARGGGGITVRVRPDDAGAATSPHLFANATPEGLDVGLAAEDGEAAARLRGALLGPDDAAVRATCAGLLAHGWIVTGVALPDAADGSLPDELRPWLVGRGLRARRRLSWSERLGEPALAEEVADLWREVLPLLHATRATRATGAAAPPARRR